MEHAESDTFRGVFPTPTACGETRCCEPVQPALGQKSGQAQWKPPSLAGQHGALMDPEAVQRAVTLPVARFS